MIKKILTSIVVMGTFMGSALISDSASATSFSQNERYIIFCKGSTSGDWVKTVYSSYDVFHYGGLCMANGGELTVVG